MLDDAATALGIDPVEIRLRNAAREGDANPLTGKRIYSAGLPECLEKGRKIFEWEKRRAECQNQQGNLRRGVGVACFSYTSNTWPVGVEIAGARLLMNQDGTINVQSGATEIGQVPTPCSRKWWQKPWEFRSAMFTLFQPKIPTLHHSTPAHLPHVRAMLPRLRCAVRHCY